MHRSLKLSFFITFQVLHFLTAVLATKRLIIQNKKKFDKSYHNIFFVFISVGSWGNFVLLFWIERKDTPKIITGNLFIIFGCFTFCSIYGMLMTVVIQANLYYNCKYKVEIQARHYTRRIFIFLTCLQIFACSTHMACPHVKIHWFYYVSFIGEEIQTFTPVFLSFRFYFRIRSIIKSVADGRMLKQMKKLFWVVVVYSFFYILQISFYYARFYNKTYKEISALLFFSSWYLLSTITPILTMMIIFKPVKYGSEKLLLNELSSDSSSLD
ncbi:hypothetical protein M0812_02858 [Anaeramoeba flamelloides]|uniref:Opsin n=1 Tax=Anaeramoeba flamelloides TaxID=1746091 RepID=A0AAV7YR63_9EUKA|nr:hypothetical protein M0812_02858 [Anaeramoeba flamelloides]